MSNFSTKDSTGQVNIGGAANERYLVFQDKTGSKNLIGHANAIDLAFNSVYLTGLSGAISLKTNAAQPISILSGADIVAEAGANADILFKRGNTQLAAFYNDAYMAGGVGGSGHSAFIFGSQNEAALDDLEGVYLDQSDPQHRIDFSIGSPDSPANAYIGGALEVKGHTQFVGTSEFDNVVTFDGTPVFKAGASFTTAGTLSIAAAVAFTTAGTFAITSNTGSTSSTSGAAIITGGVGISENLNVGGNVAITGNLQVLGTTTSVETATLTVEDNIIEVGKTTNNPNADTLYDLGVRAKYYKGSLKNFFFGYDSSAEKFVFYSDMGNPDEDDADPGTAGVQQSIVGANAVLGDVKFGKIFSNQLTPGSIPFYSVDGLDEYQVTSGGGTAALLQASTTGVNAAYVIVQSELASTSKTTGSLVVKGGLGVSGDLYATNIFASGTVTTGLAANRMVYTGANGLL